MGGYRDDVVREHWDVLVVGAGPAGLFAALGIAASSRSRVLVIDAGPDIDQRRHVRSSDLGCELVSGVGGAGLFSDGKLCLSLGVGGELGAITTAATRARLLRSVAEVLGAERLLGESGRVRRGSQRYDESVQFAYYPVFHVGTEHCADHIREVRDRVHECGSTVRSSTRLHEVDRTSCGTFRALMYEGSRQVTVTAGRVVLALGKVGAKLEERLCRRLGAQASPVPMYVGTRLEADRNDALPLFRDAIDPKFKLYFADGSKIKTHCATDGGEILPLSYDGFPLAGGHANRSRSSGRTSISILWNGIRDVVDTYEAARDVMAQSAALTGGSLLAQRVSDLLAGRPSIDSDVSRCRPSTTQWAAGDLRKILPAEYFDRLATFFEFLCRIAPGLASGRTVLLGPSIEWWMSRIETDDHLQTAVPGLYVAGDGSGWSQGIVHAAATGLLVAEGITGVAFDGGGWRRSGSSFSDTPAGKVATGP